MPKALPKYKCNKEVHALKIKSVVLHDPPPGLAFAGGYLMPEDESFAPIEITPEFIMKHEPQAGMYWVLYSDGYQSMSPAQAFESGYERVTTWIGPRASAIDSADIVIAVAGGTVSVCKNRFGATGKIA